MLAIGDKVVYPMHGAGVIDGIETRNIMGEDKQYYILKLPIGNMTVMIPTENTEAIGLREVVGPEAVKKLQKVFAGKATIANGSWNKRFNASLDQLKTGDIFEVAAVVRNLVAQCRKHRISSGEHRLLEQAKQIIISELVLSLEMAPAEVEKWIMEQISAGDS